MAALLAGIAWLAVGCGQPTHPAVSPPPGVKPAAATAGGAVAPGPASSTTTTTAQCSVTQAGIPCFPSILSYPTTTTTVPAGTASPAGRQHALHLHVPTGRTPSAHYGRGKHA